MATVRGWKESVRQAVARFEADDDEGRQEEFRQLLRSYMRFYSFIAQVMKLEDTSLEKLYSYGAWLARLLPNREIPPEIEITDDMLRLQKFKVVQKEQGEASLAAGDTAALKAISEFGAKPYTEDEKKSYRRSSKRSTNVTVLNSLKLT